MKVLIVIPAYNEEKNLPGLLRTLLNQYPQYDVVVVNDCSKDETAAICRKYGVKVLDMPVNLGIGGAVQAGYKYAYYNDYDAAVQVDGDGQHNPAYIGQLLEELERGCNLCIGSRFLENNGFQSTRTRRVGIRYLSKLIQFVTHQLVTDPTSGFRACDRKLIEFFAREYPWDYPEPETVALLRRLEYTICEIPVVMNERVEGKSSITAMKSLYYMIKVSLAIIIASIAVRK